MIERTQSMWGEEGGMMVMEMGEEVVVGGNGMD